MARPVPSPWMVDMEANRKEEERTQHDDQNVHRLPGPADPADAPRPRLSLSPRGPGHVDVTLPHSGVQRTERQRPHCRPVPRPG